MEISEEKQNTERNIKVKELKHDNLELGDRIGACRFCGQTKIIETDHYMTDEELNEAATRQCSCDAGKLYDMQCTSAEKAAANIEIMFGENAEKKEMRLDADILSSMKEIARLVAFEIIRTSTIKVGGGISAKISKTSNGTVKIERSVVNKRSLED